jgi:hypothetical protein
MLIQILAQPVVVVGLAGDERFEVDTDESTLDSDAVVTLAGQGELRRLCWRRLVKNQNGPAR